MMEVGLELQTVLGINPWTSFMLGKCSTTNPFSPVLEQHFLWSPQQSDCPAGETMWTVHMKRETSRTTEGGPAETFLPSV